MLEHVFPGDSEMARRMRAFDWSRTPLGPVERWPQALRTSVSVSLNCAFGIVLWWGPEYTILYNDEYVPILAEKHPQALGRDCPSIFSEIWETISPMFASVYERGEATRSRDLYLPLVRGGVPEESYFSFSYSPIHDDTGKVGGIFCPVIETTEKVIGERRLRLLRDLAAAGKGAANETALFAAAARVLATDAHDVPFALLYRVQTDRPVATLAASAGIAADHPAAAHTVALDAAADPWALRGAVTAAQPQSVELHGDQSLPTGAWTTPPRSAIAIPILVPGQERPNAVLVAAISPMRTLDDDYRTFFNLAGTQIAAGLADVQALEMERRRAALLAEIDRAKTAFFSNVSHEFRTPLTLMLGPLDDALSRGDLPPAAAEELAVVRRNSRRLLKLVNTLLDFSRIEAGRIQASYEATDLPALTSELASTFRSAVEKAGMQLVVDTPPLTDGDPVFVDHDMWEKIVLNLLSNAFKYTFHGSIAVSLHATPQTVTLDVTDTGTGIPADAIPHLFERFYRVENAAGRTHEGSGIGLALVNELVKLHGGTVAVSSTPNQGSTFRVTVPRGCAHLPGDRIQAARTQTSTALDAQSFVEEAERWLGTQPAGDGGAERDGAGEAWVSAPADDLAGSTIVLADDNADMLDYIARLLTRRFRVIPVRDGAAALAAVQRERPALVITDIMMPRLDGFGLLRALRTDPATRTIPVIVLSARAGEEAKVEGLDAGADAYLVKPFTARELTARVESAIRLARTRQEAERALQYRSEQFQAVLDGAPMGVYLVDADFRIRQVNPVARPVFGDIPGGVEGKNFDDIIHRLWEPDYADEVVRIFRHTLQTGEPYVAPERAELRIDRNVTEYYEWRIDRVTLPDGRYGVVCYFRDISGQVTTRLSLARSVERLTATERALQEASRQKDEFLATLAHELRNPLAPIRNSLHILRSADDGDPLTRRVHGMLERQVEQLVRLVDDLLDVARITRGQVTLHRQQVDLATVVSDAVETSRPLIEGGRHRLVIAIPEEPIAIDGDQARLTQIFANLLNNAAKYTDSGGTITLKATLDAEAVEVAVSDTGRGIAPEALPRLFEPFSRGPVEPDRAPGGLGIGLNLARKLTELHGGKLRAHSAGLGKGSTFVVRLPRASFAADERRGARLHGDVLPVMRRVLVVDDNRDAADSLGMLLQFRGSDAHVVYSGDAALQAIAEYKPTMVFLDIGMPGMDGYTVARKIRRHPDGRDVLLVALTGWGQSEDRRRAKRAGFDHHLTKPIDLDALPEILAGGRRVRRGEKDRATGRI